MDSFYREMAAYEYNFMNEFPPYCKNDYNAPSQKYANEWNSNDGPSNSVTNNKSWFMKLKSIFSCKFLHDFCNETSIHGFNHIVAPNRHILEKLGWFAATVLAGVGALQLCLEQWQRFVASPTVTALEKDYRNWNNSFMALTICQHNKYSRNPETFIESTWGVKPGDEKYEYYLKYVKVVANATLMNMETFEPYKDDETIKNVKMFDIAVEIIPPVTSSALWHDKNLANITFVNVMTDAGICHTVNSIVSRDQQITIPNSKNVQPLKEIVKCSYITHPCYLRSETLQICTSYYVHSAFNIMDVSNELVRSQCKGQDTQTEWSVVETKTSPDVRDLKIDQRKCRYYDEPEKGAVVYSSKICRRRCKNKIALKLCGCKPFFYFQEEGETCDPAGMACLGKHIEELLHAEKCSCQAQCEDAAYEMTSIRETIWTGPLGVKNSIKLGMSSPRSRYRRQILFCFEDLVVSFGGAAGLFLGCSFLSGVEIVYFVLERLTKFFGNTFCKKYMKTRRNNSVKDKPIELSNQRQKNLRNSSQNFDEMTEKTLKWNVIKKYINTIAVFENQQPSK